MRKRTDRVFHLTVAAFALTLTVLSAIGLRYQHDPQQVRSWLGFGGMPAPANPTKATQLPASTTKNPATSTKPSVTTGNHSDIALKPTFTPTANDMLVKVEPYGKDVPPATLTQVQTLLPKYHIVDLVARTLQMNIYDVVTIYLAQTPRDYKNALAGMGVSVSDLQSYSRDTDGITFGGKIIIPLYQNKASDDLANTIGHELTHAFINYNVGNLVSWMNEGLAVYIGMKTQEEVDRRAYYEGYSRQMAENVLDAVASKQLLPITAQPSQLVQSGVSYNMELQDWIAISELIRGKGYKSISDYFYRLGLSETPSVAFQRSFGISPADWNQQVTGLLQTAVDFPDQGVSITLANSAQFHGHVRILQHGSQDWRGFALKSGTTNLTVLPTGSIQGVTGVNTIHDTHAPDDSTLYIDLDPSGSLTYQGKPVDYCGFAVDYHYGLYGFVNAWVTFRDGKSVYLTQPDLFGVKLQNVGEVRQSPLGPILQDSAR